MAILYDVPKQRVGKNQTLGPAQLDPALYAGATMLTGRLEVDDPTANPPTDEALWATVELSDDGGATWRVAFRQWAGISVVMNATFAILPGRLFRATLRAAGIACFVAYRIESA